MPWKPDPDAARAKADLARELLEGSVNEIRSSEDFRRYLDFNSRFHHYSVNNILLIMCQRPTATRVAGYRAWQRLGRQVSKGEKGIMIFAPLKRKIEDRTTGETAYEMRGIKVTKVFDVSQTYGEDLPEPPVCPRLETATDLGRELLALLTEWCDAHQVGLSIRDLDGPENGSYSPLTHSIVLNARRAIDQQAKTLLHEIAHSILHRDALARERGSVEVEAESVAYIVASALGLDSTAYSAGYVAGWQGDRDWLKESMTRIQATAHSLIADLTITTPLEEEDAA